MFSNSTNLDISYIYEMLELVQHAYLINVEFFNRCNICNLRNICNAYMLSKFDISFFMYEKQFHISR